MFGSDVLDVGLGLVLLFLITSLICSAVSELLESWLKVRAMHMERGLRELLSDPKGEYAAKLYAHPLLSALFQGGYDPASLETDRAGGVKWMPLGARRRLPSYVPAANFAGALIDLTARGEVGPDATSAWRTISVDDLRLGVRDLPSPALRRALLIAIDGANEEVALVQKNLEAWYDSAMDRVSGWYKRRATVILFLIGLGAAAALNLDAVTIGQRLSGDKALRERFVAEGQARLAGGAATAGAPEKTLDQLQTRLSDLQTPMGWRDGWPAPQAARLRCKACMTGLHLGAAAQVLLGWLITAFAVTLGAPFWFDVLNRFMVVRSTIKPNQKSGDQRPVEPQASPPGPSLPAPPASPAYGLPPPVPALNTPRTQALLPPEEDLDAPAPPGITPSAAALKEVLV
jgi:hypothetical protein